MKHPLLFPSDADGISAAANLLRDGKLVAFPTETVYGLGGIATADRSVAQIFAAKDRPDFNPLIAHFPDVETVGWDVVMTPLADRLAAHFWPGPLTLVLRRKVDTRISPLLSAGLDTLAVRVPAHPVARALLSACGIPVAAPSANRSNRISPTTPDHVRRSLGGRIDAILDGGPCPVGLESTVIDATGERPALLRPGGLPVEMIEDIAGPILLPDVRFASDAPRSPGMQKRHYAPAVPLRLNAKSAGTGEVLLGFGPQAPLEGPNLSREGDLTEAAANLFRLLWELDRPGVSGIAVMPIPETGLGRAINDRLRRGATPPEADDSTQGIPHETGA